MSFLPLGGVVGSFAGTGLAQTKGSDVDRAAQDTRNAERRAASDAKATDAAGIGTTDGEGHETHDRDADGRRQWEFNRPPEAATPQTVDTPAVEPARVKDPTGVAGNELDLTG